MSKNVKKAEKALTDAAQFPIESCRERIARKYGESAVALSGPCEGANLADCVCKQLQDRWDRISDRFAGDSGKVTKLAMRVADSFSKKDDTDKCVRDLEAMGYQKTAAAGIADYLKAYAMGELMAKDMDQMMNDINTEPALPQDNGMGGMEEPSNGLDNGMDNGMDDGMDDGFGGGEDMAPEGDEFVDFDMEEPMAPGMEDAGGAEMVSIEIPMEVAQEVLNSLKSQMESQMGSEVVPGEPADMQDDANGGQFVEGEEEDAAAGCMSCGPGMAMGGEPAKEENHLEKAKQHLEMFTQEEKKPEPMSPEKHEEHEKKEHEGFKGVKENLDKAEDTDKKEDHGDDNGEKKEEGHEAMAASSKPDKVAQADGKQVGGKELGTSKGKDVEAPKPLPEGNVKPEGHTAGGNKFQDGSTMKNEEKFDAKEVKKEDVSAGEKSLMGPDESMPKDGPKVPAGSSPIHGEAWQGGELMTKGTVIASITPRGIEVQLPDGKKLLAKASISEVTPEMVKAVEAVKFEGDGKQYARATLMAAKAASKTKVLVAHDSVTISNPFEKISIKASIKSATKELVAAISKIEKSSDLKAYASKIEEVLKMAKCLPEGDSGCTHTDTGKLEGSNFTNDAEKKADDAPATPKAKEAKEEQPTYDGGKNNPENDAEKKPEADKKASANGTQKTAGEKKVEDPKPLPDGNVKPEGHSAGDNKFQDGSTLKNEEKFDAKEVKKDEVSKGESSLMGPDESMPKDGPKVPAGSGKIKNETWEGGDVSTKGTVIAELEEHKKREVAILNEAKVREARLKVASVYVADLLRNGEITEAEYSETLEKYAQMPVDAIQALIVTSKKARDKAKARVEANAAASRPEQRQAGISFPVVISSMMTEKSLKERLVENFKLTRKLDELDGMKSDK